MACVCVVMVMSIIMEISNLEEDLHYISSREMLEAWAK